MAGEDTMKKWPIESKPECFDSDAQWRDWYICKGDAQYPCIDCTASYQAQMMSEGRCERPDALFVVRWGEIAGICADQHGYLAALQAHPYSPELEARVMSATMPRNIRRDIEQWAQKGKSNG